MKHLIPFTKDQLSIIKTSLSASTKYSDAEYIEEVQTIIKVIEENSSVKDTGSDLDHKIDDNIVDLYTKLFDLINNVPRLKK